MKKHIKAILCFGGLLLLIQLGFLQVHKTVEKYNNTQIEIDIKDGESSHESISMTMEVTKTWDDYDENEHRLSGAQYDAVVYNTGKYNFKNWKIVVNMTEEARVDSLWNGEYQVNGTVITLTPMDYNGVVEAGKDQPFGFVAISEKIMNMNNYTVYGYFEKTMRDMPMYWVMLTLMILWAFALACYIIVRICLIGYKRRQKRDEKIILQTMDTFISFIDAKDPYTHGHSERVAQYVKLISEHMGLDADVVRNYYYIALMHDCGKISIPDNILNKASKLEPAERKVIESHTKVGASILKGFTAIPGIQDGALHHHERYDGNGYPDELKGEDISLVSRILCVADAFDAMNSDRCYRKKLPQEKIVSELKENSGKQFDSNVVQHLLDIINSGGVEDWGLE